MNSKFNISLDTIRAPFAKIRALFLFSKKGRGGPAPPSSCAAVYMSPWGEEKPVHI